MAKPAPPSQRSFLMLQGPHGPFFWHLGNMLKAAGAQVWRVGFNAGDKAFWRARASFIPFNQPQDEWAERFDALVSEKNITDIVLYGDTRPIHKTAVARAKALGLTIHVFEEGYIRPYWISYERDGSNGNSALMTLSLKDMRKALASQDPNMMEPPARWGEMRHHIFYGALYHWFVMFKNGAFKHFKRHRELPVSREFQLYFKALVLTPYRWASRSFNTSRILAGGHPFHIALLQLEHDTNFQEHSPYSDMPAFFRDVIEGFAKGAPKHHHLVLKAHPLETMRRNLIKETHKIARELGCGDRVHFVRGGKLQKLLYTARSAITVNSTAGQQVLSLGLPLKAMGSAVYSKPEFVSNQEIDAFFAHPDRPDGAAYRDYRQFLMETSQIPGGYYSSKGRRQVLRLIVDVMLTPEDPYQALLTGKALPRQPQRILV